MEIFYGKKHSRRGKKIRKNEQVTPSEKYSSYPSDRNSKPKP